jgi:phosphoribosyl 1,2-cyclic phosphate phosphodiesterase
MIGCDCGVCRSTDARDKRYRASIYIECDDGMRVLVDATPDLRAQALRHDIRHLDAILVTHTHADHVMGMDEVRRFNVLTGGPIPVYGDGATTSDLRRLFAYAFDSGLPFGAVPALRLWPLGGRFMLGRQEVTPVPIQHGSSTVLGFRFGGFAYLTDCNGIPPASAGLLRDLDVLVLDGLRHAPHPTHFTLEESMDTARALGARRTYFTHMAHDLGHEATCAALPPDMTLAYDGLTLEI